jgi:hypothetical protein
LKLLSNYFAGGAENNCENSVRIIGFNTEIGIRDLGKRGWVGPGACMDNMEQRKISPVGMGPSP